MHLPGRDTKMPRSRVAHAGDDPDGDEDDEEADRGSRDPRVPDFDQIVIAGGSPLGVPHVRGHEPTHESDLRDDVDGIINASDFIEMTDGAQILFI